MDDGLKQYMVNLEATQRRDHADKDIIDQYARLADRAVASEAKKRELEAELREFRTSDLSPRPKDRVATPTKQSSPAPASDSNTQLRAQLTEAQKARAMLEVQASTIPGLQANKASQAKAIVAKDREIASLKRKLRDQEEELKERKKLGENVQDEMISLNLQVNIAEQKAERLQVENTELVERWMKRMGEEAERMNEQSKW